MKTFGEQKHCALDRFKPYQRPKLSDPAHEGARLQPGRDGRVRCSAWLGVRPRPRLMNCCALELSDVPLIAEDSRQPTTKRKPLELATRSRSLVTLRLELCGVRVWGDAATPNGQSSATRPASAPACNSDARAGFAGAHGSGAAEPRVSEGRSVRPAKNPKCAEARPPLERAGADQEGKPEDVTPLRPNRDSTAICG
jgi:hypothetical protein